MASAFSLTYSTIMYQAQRAPIPSLRTCSGWEMSVLSILTFPRGGRSPLCGEVSVVESDLKSHRELCVWFEILHFFTSQSLHLHFLSVATVFFFCRLFCPCFTVHPPIPPHCVTQHLILSLLLMLNGLFSVQMLSKTMWSAPLHLCRWQLHVFCCQPLSVLPINLLIFSLRLAEVETFRSKFRWDFTLNVKMCHRNRLIMNVHWSFLKWIHETNTNALFLSCFLHCFSPFEVWLVLLHNSVMAPDWKISATNCFSWWTVWIFFWWFSQNLCYIWMET